MPKTCQVDFQCRTSSPVVHEVEFIGHHTANIGDKFCTMTQERVQFLRCANEDIAIIDVFCFSRSITNAQADRQAGGCCDVLQVLIFLHRQGLERHDVNRFGPFMAFRNALDHAHVCEQGFTRCRGDSDQGVSASKNAWNSLGLRRMQAFNAPIILKKIKERRWQFKT